MSRVDIDYSKADLFAKKLDAKLDDVGVLVTDVASKICPKDTGRLSSSIDYEVNETAHKVSIGTDVPYSIHVEYGTYKTRSQPFLRPSLVISAKRIMRMFKNVLS